MAIPAAFTAALAQPEVRPEMWLELEGIPYAFGMLARSSSFFSGRSAAYRRLSILPSLLEVPAGIEQEVKPLDGDSSIGSMEFRLDPDDSAGCLLGLLSNIGRTDGLCPYGPPVWKGGTVYASGDIVRPTSAGTGAGIGLAFKCTTGGTSSGSEPTWPASGTVGDGGAVWTAQTSLYPRNLAAEGPYLGAMCVQGNLPDSVIDGTYTYFIGRETLLASSRSLSNGGTVTHLTGVSRGYHQLPGHELYYAHAEGEYVSAYPRFLATRRVALMVTLDGTDANKVVRWSGALDGRAKMEAKLGEVRLTAGSTLGEVKQTLFGNQLRAKLSAGLADGQGVYEPEDANEPAFKTSSLSLVADSKSGPWDTLAAGTVRYFRVDDEYIRGSLAADSNGSVAVTARGLFGTLADQHKPGTDVCEVMILAKQDSNVPEFSNTGFTATGDSPVDLALQMLCSTGAANNGSYDTLPAGWGCGIAQSRIDLAGSLQMRDRWLAGIRHVEIIEEPFEAKAKIAEILAPHAFYVMTRLNDIFAIRRVQPPLPDLPVRSITHAKLLAPASWESDFQSVIGRVLWRCDHDPTDGESRQTFCGEIQGPGLESQELYAGLYQTLEVTAKGQFTGGDLSTGVPSSALATGAQEAALAFIELVKDRYSKPWPVLEVECSYDCLDVEPGDLIALTALHVPNALLGGRGLSGEIFEVLARTITDKEAKVQLRVIQALYGRQGRLLAPAGTVSAVGSNYVDLATQDFSQQPGVVKDAAYFVPGDVVSFKTSQLVDRAGPYTIQSVSTNRVTFTGAIASVQATDLMLLAPYGSTTTTRKARNAYLCSAAEQLGGSDPAHQYVG